MARLLQFNSIQPALIAVFVKCLSCESAGEGVFVSIANQGGGEILFYSGLRSPVRFFYFYPLMMETQLRTSFRDETLRTLGDSMPDYLILVNERTSHLISGEDPFILSLMRLFYRYKLAAFINDVSEEVIDYRSLPDVEKLVRHDGNILVFVKEPPSADLLDFGPIFESYLKRVSIRLQIERYLQ